MKRGDIINQLTIVVFRGTGGVLNTENPYYSSEPALIRAGHFGVIGAVEDKIIGFHPTPEAAEAVGGERALLEKLGRHEAVPGRLQDDTTYFERAAELAKQGSRTTVYMYAVEVSDETLAEIRSWYNDGKETPYNFPDDETGLFEQDESNCAWFWTRFGITLPRSTGSIKEIIREMRVEDYDVWSKS